ncbi:unnamed protein product [Polarella glacialis]|uniref:Peptide-methionine (R)-S-oxide reductase n=1 Tax=Polarella glacialis TaxID=89957 RepID=A0A813DTG8_POLGL|nr:unnamed protein product [Polarella glacialis]
MEETPLGKTSWERWKRFAATLGSLLAVLLFVAITSASAGGWDYLGSKGSSVAEESCTGSRVHRDGAERFQQVCLHGGTEPARSGIYDHSSNNSGVYRCACCGTPLFTAGDKFDSGTGWPSFKAPVAQAMGYRKDLLALGSTEVHCSTCGAHLGHVFEDGPSPTGLRYCINSVCLWLDADSVNASDYNIPWVANSYLMLALLISSSLGCCLLSKRAGEQVLSWRNRSRVEARGVEVEVFATMPP